MSNKDPHAEEVADNNLKVDKSKLKNNPEVETLLSQADGVPPRVSVERQHKDVLTGALRWRGLNPTANKIVDRVVAEEYLSIQEHTALLSQVRAEAVSAFAESILHGDEKHRAWLRQAASDFAKAAVEPAKVGEVKDG